MQLPEVSSFNYPDHLNTPRLVADATGMTVWRWDQAEPFGVNTPDENPSALGAFEFPLRFPGQYADKETNVIGHVVVDVIEVDERSVAAVAGRPKDMSSNSSW